jgi:leucyl-tRNA synthetase
MKSGENEGMGANYDATAVEEKWQREWKSAAAFAAPPPDDRQSSYVLASCPLPSEGVDFGHIRSYAIADAYARFRRASGEAVLFSVGAASADGIQARLERLGCSCDWSRVADASQPAQYRWTQWLFLELLERELVYEKDRRWYLRSTGYLGANEEGLDNLSAWNEPAAQSQRAAVGKVEGFEVDATVLGVGQFPAFTPHGDEVAGAAFVALSPLFPNIEVFAQEPEVAGKLEKLRESSHQPRGGEVPPVQTGLQASVPGVDDLLPVVIWPAVESRFGPTALLGLPDLDETDRRVADGMKQASSLGGIKLSAKSSGKPRPATRYKAEDILISRPWAEGGVALPIVHCDKCGSVPASREHLPVELATSPGEGEECECPGCGGAARRAVETIDPRLDGMWIWMSICVPAEDRQGEMFGHAECQRWLPAAQVVAGPGAGELLFDQRLAAKVLEDIEALPRESREPFQRAFVHETVRVDEKGEQGAGIGDPDELVERVGADAVRLALLTAAAPTTAFRWTETPIRHGQRFLEELWQYAEPRLRDWSGSEAGEIDPSTPLRRRLATWVRIGADKVTTNLEQLDMQRATRNMRLLLTRIRDFEERATAAGELGDADRAAIVDSLLVLLRLLAPCAPHVCEELWELSGQESLLAAAPWPAGSETSSNDADPRVRSSTG